ncbi:MAG TPA: serine hydrolase, partial [Flavisolibacter sp.]|nr:serine hydrolase [Flavisolibacter sp.]
PDTYRLQVIYTQITRDKKNRPTFTNYFFHYDPALYFNPASMVKMPLAFLSLEKLNELHQKDIDKYTTILFDSSEAWQHPLYKDTSAASRLPSIAHFIKRAFLISENDPYNRMYQFVGQGETNRKLHQKGYTDVRITRQFLGLTPEQNRRTPAIRFTDANGKTIYSQPPAVNTDSFDFSQTIKLGKGYMNRNDSLIEEPFDFTKHNNLSLLTMQQLLQSVLFPASVPTRQRFNLSKEDYRFLHQYLSQYPSETPDPKYDTTHFYDSYVKFFFRDSTHRMPPGVRVFNKVGWSYGFLTDVSYVVDFNNKVEFMLAATLYVNSDGILNDNKYEYNSTGYPFLYQLGQTVYRYELTRKRSYRPDLSAFKIQYEHRDPKDTRPSLVEVDN